MASSHDDYFCPLVRIHNNLSIQDELEILNLKVPIPKNESKRIKVLREAEILDTEEEQEYDRYTSLASRVFKVLLYN
jgi:hypothetical protein